MYKYLICLSFLGFLLTNLMSAQSFQSSELSIPAGYDSLYGTLLMPDNFESKKVVLFHSGSGPTDRDGNSQLTQNNGLKMLAEALAEKGIASFRFDKRVAGKSIKAVQKEEDITIDSLIDDTKRWMGILKGMPQFDKFYLLGHSEGALIGLVAASDIKVDGYISLAGAGSRADMILKKQLGTQLATLPQLKDEVFNALDTLAMGQTVKKVNPMLMSLLRPSVQPYMISWFKYDPQEYIKKIDGKKVLIVQGTTDIQVKVEDAEMLYTAQPDAQKVIIEGMNHVLKEAPMDQAQNIATYSKPDLPIVQKCVDVIADFILK
ncbi:MAG: alpha/beta hydrolase [Bacteroidota bacterium]